ncbi:MAG TPA: hypothetical protein VKJ65_04650, partial [Phycisphaerae bacterium]|nr:hypothetical protein [Phycisphaerae bacterium]
MTVSELEQAGLVLFGKGWRSAMADELDVDKSTIRRWMASDSIPKIVELAVDGLRLHQRIMHGAWVFKSNKAQTVDCYEDQYPDPWSDKDYIYKEIFP